MSFLSALCLSTTEIIACENHLSCRNFKSVHLGLLKYTVQFKSTWKVPIFETQITTNGPVCFRDSREILLKFALCLDINDVRTKALDRKKGEPVNNAMLAKWYLLGAIACLLDF